MQRSHFAILILLSTIVSIPTAVYAESTLSVDMDQPVLAGAMPDTEEPGSLANSWRPQEYGSFTNNWILKNRRSVRKPGNPGKPNRPPKWKNGKPVKTTNDIPNGIPTIIGAIMEDQMLTTSTSKISDGDGIGRFRYQWLRDGAAIPGATTRNYRLGDPDVNTSISVSVFYTDGGNTTEGPLTSLSSSLVENVNDSPLGVPTIVGTPVENHVLSIDTSNVEDADGLGFISYQWLRDGTAISRANKNTYFLDDSDVNSKISVRVYYLDGSDNAEGPLTSLETEVVKNANDNPLGIPTVIGTMEENQILIANTNDISDSDGLGDFSYQWRRDGGLIANATNSSYTLVKADVNSQISVSVYFTDGKNTTEGPLTSELGIPVTSVEDVPYGLPVIIGIMAENQTLTVDTSGISDSDGLANFSYQWLRNGGLINGATSSSYTLDDADVRSQISVSVNFTDGNTTLEGPLTSQLGIPVVSVNDEPVGVPIIIGTMMENQILTVDTGNIRDDDGLGDFSYKWLRNGAVIPGTNGNSYTLVEADVNAKISVSVSFTDGNDTPEGPLTSQSGIPVANANDAPVGTPKLVGTIAEDQILTVDTSGISDSDGLGNFSYQWLRDDVVIPGATGSSFALDDIDVNTQISVNVYFTDGNNTLEGPLRSQSSVPVANVNDAPVGIPAIIGTTVENDVLTADTSGIKDADGIGSFKYQWLRNGVVISNATSSDYTLVNADVGARISVRVNYTDGNNFNETNLISLRTETITSLPVQNTNTVEFQVADATVNESQRTTTLVVSRSGDATEALTVNYNSADQTASGGLDYLETSGTLQWDAGDTGNRDITLTVFSDLIAEPTEYIDMFLTNPVGTESLGSISTMTITVSDSACSETLAGTVDSTLTLSEHCYVLTEQLTIDNGGRLIINPGVTIIAQAGTQIIVGPQGSISSNGTSLSPVQFIGSDSIESHWAGISLQDSYSINNVFTYTYIQDAQIGLNLTHPSFIARYSDNRITTNTDTNIDNLALECSPIVFTLLTGLADCPPANNPPTDNILFEEDFNSQANWTSGDAPGNPKRLTASDGIPTGWFEVLQQPRWAPSKGFPDKNEAIEILDSNADKSRGGNGKSAVFWRESQGRFGNDKIMLHKLDGGQKSVYVEFYLRFSPDWTTAATGKNYGKIFRIYAWDDVNSTNPFVFFSRGNAGPIFIWDYGVDGFGARNLTALRGGPYGENYTMSTPAGYPRNFISGSLGSATLNFTGNTVGQAQGGGTPQIADLVNGGYISDNLKQTVSHSQIYGSPDSQNWTKMAFYVSLNSAPGATDGVLTQWINDERILHNTNIPWIGPTSVNFDRIKWNLVGLGGNDYLSVYPESEQHKEWYSIDDLKILDSVPEGL